jgi:ABC-type sugar transport system ATPase subunit
MDTNPSQADTQIIPVEDDSLQEQAHDIDATPVVVLRGISKHYPGVQALSNVDFTLLPGTVHAISGENGAGKSTLAKILAGLIKPDEGHIYIEGREVTLHSPGDARRLGVSAVPQELSLVPELSVAENISVASFPTRAGLVSRRALEEQAQPVLAALGLKIDPFSLLGEHSPGVQQLVMIGRSLVNKAKVIILDEPTAALTEPEVNHLIQVVEKTKDTGTAFILVSHRFQDLTRLADTVTILRDGVRIVTAPMASMTHDEIVKAMVGRTIERFVHDVQAAPQAGKDIVEHAAPRLSVKNLTSLGKFEDVSFHVMPGEIVGLGGLLGAGRTEVARAIFGVDKFDSGSIEINGVPTRIRSPKSAIHSGMMMVPEERKSQGLVLGLTIQENFTTSQPRTISRFGWLKTHRERTISKDLIERLGVKTSSATVPVNTLSGGNQQKVVIARCFLDDFHVYIFDEPTRGIDVNAKFQIYRLINGLAKSGAGVLLISSELSELLAVADRILVMSEGRLVDEIPAEKATEEQILSSAMVQRPATNLESKETRI